MVLWEVCECNFAHLFHLVPPFLMLRKTCTTAKNTLHVYCCTTDGGPNELACRKLANVLTRDTDNVLFLEATCMEHCHHLVTMGSLQLIDTLLSCFAGRSWKYYSSLAILTNVLRSVARQVFLTWSEFYGAESAAKTVKKMFPRCCSTRWGSIHTTEERVMAAGCSDLHDVLKAVLADKIGKDAKNKSKQKKGK